MNNKTGIALLTVLPLCGSALYTAAEDFVIREYTLPLEGIDELDVHASVGSVRIVPATGSEVQVVLEIEAQHRDGWFRGRGRRDVSDVELQHDVRGKRLVLRQTEDDTTTDWTIRMPAVARTSIELGVGDIDAELGATELDIDLGVGDVDVILPQASTGDIDVAVGVGDARLRGADDVTYGRAFVSQDVSGRGEGELEVRIDVGVGDADLRLE